MTVRRLLTALTLLVSMPWLSLGSPGTRAYENGADLVDNRVAQALALMPWALGHLGLDGQAIHIWPPC